MRTKTLLVFLYAVHFFVMLPLTCFLYNSDRIDLFGQGTSVISVYSPDRLLSTSLLILSIVVLFIYKIIRIWKICSIILMLLWCLSGRTIGFYPIDVRISTGWFYISFSIIELYSEKEKNCGLVLKHATAVEGFGNSFIKVRNPYVNEAIYTGPLIYEEAIAELRSLTIERDIDSLNELPPK